MKTIEKLQIESEQKLKRNIVYNSKGITLVAVVITVIVLIILAGVSISLILGDNGTVIKAKQAKTETEQAKQNEEIKLNEAIKYVEDNESENGGSTTPDETVFTKLKKGDYIKYNTGISGVGENGVIACRVLYDSSSEYGVQIISDKNVANLTLGGSNWTTGRDSYNNVIVTLNTEAEKYLNTKYATDARCVGSVPTLQNGIYVNKNSENVGPFKLQFTSTVAGANNMKSTDTNYETDKTQMESLNIWITGEKYWLTSRNVNSQSSSCGFRVRFVNASGGLDYGGLCNVSSNSSTRGYSATIGFRPCFSLKSDIKITGGNGTSEEPYTM